MGRKKIQKPEKGAKVNKKASESESEPEEPQQQKVEDAVVNEEPEKGKRGRKAATSKVTASEPKTQKKGNSQESEVELFDDKFSSKVTEFRQFYRDYLQLRATNTGNDNVAAELRKVSEQVRNKIQTAALKVLRQDLQEAVKWIEDQQKTIRTQIEGVDKIEQSVRQSFEGNSAFSSAEIDSQVENIRKKRLDLQLSLQNLEDEKNRAQQIYQQQANGNNQIDQE